MPHSNIRTTAPENPSPRWPDGYVNVLREVGAQEKTIPYCMGWVRRFFAEYPGRRRRDLGRVEIETFLRKLASGPNVTNRQVQQARDALELYYERFRGISLSPRPNVQVPRHPLPSGVKIAISDESARTPISRTAKPQTATTDKSYSEPNADGKGFVSRNHSTRQAAATGHNHNLSKPAAGQSNPSSRVMTSGEPRGNQTDEFIRKKPTRTEQFPPLIKTAQTLDWKALEAKIIEIVRLGHYSYRTEQTYVGCSPDCG